MGMTVLLDTPTPHPIGMAQSLEIPVLTSGPMGIDPLQNVKVTRHPSADGDDPATGSAYLSTSSAFLFTDSSH